MTAASHGARIWQLSRILNDCLSKALQPIVKRYGITQQQAQLLFSVYKNKATTVGTLAARLGLARTNASSMCKKLSNMGFLKRLRREDDERIVSVSLTEMGEDAALAIESRIRQVYVENYINMEEVDKMVESFSSLSTRLTEDDE